MVLLEGFQPSRELLERLVKIPGVSGFEDRIREELRSLVEGLGRVEVDRVGNLVLHLGGSGPRILIAAHMDELGLVVTGIGEDGLLAFRKLGGIDDSILPSTHVLVHGSKGPVPGVIGAEPPHLRMTRKGDEKPRPWYELRIDVGADSRDEAVSLGVDVLDPVTFQKQVSYLAGGKYIATRGLDDRAGCSALVELAKLVSAGEVEPRAEVILAWTVQEEVGIRGARALSTEYKPDAFIAVDTSTCCHPAITGDLRLGKGPVLRAVDNYYIAHPGLAKAIVAAAREHGVPLQVATAGGGTDAGAFQLQGVPSAAVSAPVKYTHSLVEKMHLGDYRDWVRALAAIITSPPTL